MKVVLDTNIVWRTRGRLLQGTEVEVITKSGGNTNVEIVVPEIVKKELYKKFREDFRELDRSVKRLSGLLVKKSTRPKFETTGEQALEDYREALDERLEELGVSCPGHDTIPHSRILDRDIAGRKPFGKNGKGYRDALIWEVVLHEVAGKGHKTILVTDNFKDFAEPKSDGQKLHHDLGEDLRANDLPASAVVLCRSLDDLKHDHILSKLDFLPDVRKELETGAWGFLNLASFFESNFDEILSLVQGSIEDADQEVAFAVAESVRLSYLDLPDIYIVSMDEPEYIGVTEVRRLSETETLVSTEMELEVEIEFLVPKPEAFALPDDSRGKVAILDYDWNKWMVEAGTCMVLEVQLDLILDLKKETVASFDVTSVTARAR